MIEVHSEAVSLARLFLRAIPRPPLLLHLVQAQLPPLPCSPTLSMSPACADQSLTLSAGWRTMSYLGTASRACRIVLMEDRWERRKGSGGGGEGVAYWREEGGGSFPFRSKRSTLSALDWVTARDCSAGGASCAVVRETIWLAWTTTVSEPPSTVFSSSTASASPFPSRLSRFCLRNSCLLLLVYFIAHLCSTCCVRPVGMGE